MTRIRVEISDEDGDHVVLEGIDWHKLRRKVETYLGVPSFDPVITLVETPPDPLTMAESMAMLSGQGLTHNEVARQYRISASSVSNYLRLLQLPERVKGLIRSGQLSNAHARALCSLDGWPEQQIEMAQKAIDEKWNARQIEQVCKQFKLNPQCVRTGG